MSSLMDTWLSVVNVEGNGERNRGLYVLKSRGMSHSNQIREFRMSRDGVRLLEPYIGPAGVLIGSARAAQEAQERRTAERYGQEVDRRTRELTRKREATERQIQIFTPCWKQTRRSFGNSRCTRRSRRWPSVPTARP